MYQPHACAAPPPPDFQPLGAGVLWVVALDRAHASEPSAALDSQARFDPTVPAALEVMRGEGGHVLVKGRLEGPGGAAAEGWFVVDPSAGGLAVTKDVADEASMAALGARPLPQETATPPVFPEGRGRLAASRPQTPETPPPEADERRTPG